MREFVGSWKIVYGVNFTLFPSRTCAQHRAAFFPDFYILIAQVVDDKIRNYESFVVIWLW